VDGDNLYFTDTEGYFYSYNTQEGRLNWEPVQPDSSAENAITASPLVLGDLVLLATEPGEVYAVDNTGNIDTWYSAAMRARYTQLRFGRETMFLSPTWNQIIISLPSIRRAMKSGHIHSRPKESL
jgi:hypothetical protein